MAETDTKPLQPSKQKPWMRGTLHHYSTFVALAMGVMLVLDAKTPVARWGCAVYTVAVFCMFGVSALYHRPTWTPEARARMRKLDHAAIFLQIAGSYTPIALLSFPGGEATRLLSFVWAGALAGMLQPVLLPHAPKPLKAALYVALGWAIVPYAGELRQALGPASELLIVAGGIAYSVGAVVYALRSPDPWPRTWGYHEVFHLLVTLAAFLQFCAIYRMVHGMK